MGDQSKMADGSSVDLIPRKLDIVFIIVHTFLPQKSFGYSA